VVTQFVEKKVKLISIESRGCILEGVLKEAQSRHLEGFHEYTLTLTLEDIDWKQKVQDFIDETTVVILTGNINDHQVYALLLSISLAVRKMKSTLYVVAPRHRAIDTTEDAVYLEARYGLDETGHLHSVHDINVQHLGDLNTMVLEVETNLPVKNVVGSSNQTNSQSEGIMAMTLLALMGFIKGCSSDFEAYFELKLLCASDKRTFVGCERSTFAGMNSIDDAVEDAISVGQSKFPLFVSGSDVCFVNLILRSRAEAKESLMRVETFLQRKNDELNYYSNITYDKYAATNTIEIIADVKHHEDNNQLADFKKMIRDDEAAKRYIEEFEALQEAEKNLTKMSLIAKKHAKQAKKAKESAQELLRESAHTTGNILNPGSLDKLASELERVRVDQRLSSISRIAGAGEWEIIALNDLNLLRMEDEESFRRELRTGIANIDDQIVVSLGSILNRAFTHIWFACFESLSDKLRNMRRSFLNKTKLDISNLKMVMYNSDNAVLESDYLNLIDWVSKNICPIKIQVGDVWHQVRIKPKSKLDSWLYKLLNELLLNAFKYNTFSANALMSIKFGAVECDNVTYLTITIQNETEKTNVSLGTGHGIDLLKEELEMLNQSQDHCLTVNHEGVMFSVSVFIKEEFLIYRAPKIDW